MSRIFLLFVFCVLASAEIYIHPIKWPQWIGSGEEKFVEERNKSQEIVEEWDNKFVELYNAHNMTALVEELFEENCQFEANHKYLVGRESLAKFMEEQLGMGIMTVKFMRLHNTMVGDKVFTSGRFLCFYPEDKDKVQRGIFTELLRKGEDGKYRVSTKLSTFFVPGSAATQQ